MDDNELKILSPEILAEIRGIEKAIKIVSDLEYGKSGRRALDGVLRVLAMEIKRIKKTGNTTI